MTDHQAATVDDAVHAEQRPVWPDDHNGSREVRLRSRRRARVVASVLAGLVAVAVARWAWVSFDLLAETGLDATWSWLRIAQFVIAVPGVISGVAAFAYLVVLIVHGYTWRYWREVATVFFALVVAWGVTYGFGVLVF